MLPFDNRPWAKTLARIVIALSIVAAALGAYLYYVNDDLHISEVAIIVLSLLLILPPNIAIVLRKDESSDPSAIRQAHLRTR